MAITTWRDILRLFSRDYIKPKKRASHEERVARRKAINKAVKKSPMMIVM